jgi:zinc transport system ATP-binding protein
MTDNKYISEQGKSFSSVSLHKAVEVKDLTVILEGRLILDNINLTIYEREIVAIVGPNGGGKTTFLKTLIGLIKPTKGKIEIFGYPPEEAVKRHFIGYVPQKYLFKKETCLSVYDVVSLGMWYKKVSKKEKEKIIDEILEFLEIKELKNLRYSVLSGGQQQKVNIARALAQSPKLLLLDEPTAGIDFPSQKKFYEMIRRIRDEKKLTIIMVSHDVGVVWKYVDKAVCINKKLHYHGEPKCILDVELLKKVYGTTVVPLFHQHHHNKQSS